MDNRRNFHSLQRHGFSTKSLLVGAVFIVTLAAALFVDADGLLEYFNLISGPANPTLELGGIITAAAAIPLLAMGMVIADDEMHRND
jgi:hypothetical protein